MPRSQGPQPPKGEVGGLARACKAPPAPCARTPPRSPAGALYGGPWQCGAGTPTPSPDPQHAQSRCFRARPHPSIMHTGHQQPRIRPPHPDPRPCVHSAHAPSEGVGECPVGPPTTPPRFVGLGGQVPGGGVGRGGAGSHMGVWCVDGRGTGAAAHLAPPLRDVAPQVLSGIKFSYRATRWV